MKRKFLGLMAFLMLFLSGSSEVCVLPRSSFVLEPDYADITKRLRLMSQPLTKLFLFHRNVDSLEELHNRSLVFVPVNQ